MSGGRRAGAGIIPSSARRSVSSSTQTLSRRASSPIALNLDVTDALAIARQVEDDVAHLLHAFSS
jgi:hypothetical protein